MVEDQFPEADTGQAKDLTHDEIFLSGPSAMHPIGGMEPSPILTSAHKIAIAGLGLIGGSLAKRLVRRGRFVVAWNHTDSPYEAAQLDGIRCVPDLEDLAREKPDILVLATPLNSIPAMLNRLAPVLEYGTTLTDVGSVKGQVRRQVQEAGLSDKYVGAHPMAGSEFSGYGASDPDLLEGALWALTVDDTTDYKRFLTVADMVTQGVGNRLIVLDDETHDRAAALISHMPHVVATALAGLLVDSADRNVAAALAAGSWRDMTRVALTDPKRTEAMVVEDADQVALLLEDLISTLTDFAHSLKDGQGQEAVSIRHFFNHPQPFRDYKKAMKGQPGSEGKDRNGSRLTLTVNDENWQSLLVESAKRGQEVESFLTTHEVNLLQMPTIGADRPFV